MTRENIMEAMNGIGEHLIVEAAEKLGFVNGSAVVVKAERRKGPSAFSRFMNSGWGVAAVCALVAVSVMGGIIWAGNQPGVNPPVVTPEESETEEITEPMIVPDTSEDISQDPSETETEASESAVAETETEVETETETSQPTDLRYFQFPLVNAKDTTSYISLPDMTAEGEQAIEFFVVPSDTETPELTSAYKIHVSKDFPMNIQLVVIKSKEGEGACILYRMEKAQPDEYDMIEADGTVVLECCVLDFDRTAEYGYYSRYYSSNDPNWGDYRFTYVNGTKVSMGKYQNNLRYLKYAEYFIRSNGYDDPEKYEYTVLYSYIDGVETVNTPVGTLPEFPCTIFNAYNEPDTGN